MGRMGILCPDCLRKISPSEYRFPIEFYRNRIRDELVYNIYKGYMKNET